MKKMKTIIVFEDVGILVIIRERILKTGLDTIDNEIEVMKSMSHQNIIRLFEVINDPLSDNIYIGSFIKFKLVNICKMDS